MIEFLSSDCYGEDRVLTRMTCTDAAAATKGKGRCLHLHRFLHYTLLKYDLNDVDIPMRAYDPKSETMDPEYNLDETYQRRFLIAASMAFQGTPHDYASSGGRRMLIE